MRSFPSNINIYSYGMRKFISLKDACSLMSWGFGRHYATIKYCIKSRELIYESYSSNIDIKWKLILDDKINIKISPTGDLILLTRDYLLLLKQFIDEYFCLIVSKYRFISRINSVFPTQNSKERFCDFKNEYVDKLQLFKELSI